MTDGTGHSRSDTDQEEYWVRYPAIPDQRKVYIRVIDRENAEILGEGDAVEDAESISLYGVWKTDRETGLSPAAKSQTPWGGQAPDDGTHRDWRCENCGSRPRLKHKEEPEHPCRHCGFNEWYVHTATDQREN